MIFFSSIFTAFLGIYISSMLGAPNSALVFGFIGFSFPYAIALEKIVRSLPKEEMEKEPQVVENLDYDIDEISANQCPACYSEISEDTEWCPSCGLKLTDE